MEVDSGAVAEADGVDASGNAEVERKNTPEKEPKVKRKMKTPTQLELLEKTYAVEPYPSEALRGELSVKLGLSDRQLQMWFCHRRLKDRKPATEKRQKKTASSSAVAASPGENVTEPAVNNAVGSKDQGAGLCLFENNTDLQHQQRMHRVVHKVGAAVPRISPELRRFCEPPLAISEQRAIRYVEMQLGEPLREDGPILGMEFDPLPPGAFGAPIVPSEQKRPAGRFYDAQLYEKLDVKPIQGASRAVREFQFLPDKPLVGNDLYERFSAPHFYPTTIDVSTARISSKSGAFPICGEQVPSGYFIGQIPIPKMEVLAQQGRPDIHLSPAPGEIVAVPTVISAQNADMGSPHLIRSVSGVDIQLAGTDRSDRKRKAEEARIAKEAESHEKKMRKELEKQNVLMRKREEQMRKEMERQVREQRKEEEKLLREKQREEERYQREQRREMERREKFMRKEYIRAEKRTLREEMRKEKEAAKLKAANDRAVARRVAKESVELFEDERLELMEIAAQSRNLPSILSLDSWTFKNLDSFKEKLMEFPPKSVPLKRPFPSHPWADSEENVGNLLMVWRFLIAFADVLGLWPFTLDEFMQALHDFDSRLLGEIHIALLRSIIRDIEDVARTSAASMAANQNSAAVPAGGHPRIVEGAYAWGFDLLSWQHLLTPLTWPEVLRQFALSAGFGPKLKKASAKSAYCPEENEGDSCADNISNLRSGVAAENAFAKMQERGFSRPRKSRHRLTPGTVKFAAFHVLSVEGSLGLSILEVADKIQRSGLRDLTTSKTPEASISAALSRDTKLFERTAPSTYCVRSPYRKSPADAEAILAAARERVRLFISGSADDEVAEDVEKDEAERDADSESDIADDPDVGSLTPVEKLTQEASHSREADMFENGEQSKCPDANGFTSGGSATMDEIKGNGAVADGCDSGEHWVQELTGGEYAKLSVEDRLNALAALVGIANEGNAIRVALEERLEAANALKKQMWAEAQVDKRRAKEETSKPPYSTSDAKTDSPSVNPVFRFIDLNDQQSDEKELSLAECSLVSENLLEPSGCAAEKSRSDTKALIGHRAEEVYTYRSLPLGQDRRRNRYWQFAASPSCSDPGSGRIFVELGNNSWRQIDSEEGFNCLLSSLDVRGIRESHLHSMLRSIEASFRDYVKRSLLELEHIGRRHEEVETWMWRECFSPSTPAAMKHGTVRRPRLVEICDGCHGLVCPSLNWVCSCSDQEEGVVGFSGFSMNVSLPPRIKLLKAQLSEIEACIPDESFKLSWSEETRRAFATKLLMASTAEELLQITTVLEYCIRKEFLSANFMSTSELLSSSNEEAGLNQDSSLPEEVPVLPWIPLTAPAVALRLLEIDSAIFYSPEQKSAHHTKNETGFFSKYSSMCSSLGISVSEAAKDRHLLQNSSLGDPATKPTSSKRGRGRPRGPSRTRGGKSKKSSGLIFHGRRGRQLGRGSGRRGHSSMRGRWSRAPRAAAAETVEDFVDDEQPGKQDDDTRTRDLYLQPDPVEARDRDEANSSGRSEFDDDNGGASQDEYDEAVKGGAFSASKSGHTVNEEYDDDDDEEDEDDKDYEDDAGGGNEYYRNEEQVPDRDRASPSPSSASGSTSSGYSY